MKRAFRGKLKLDMEALISAFHHFIAVESVKLCREKKDQISQDELFTDRTDLAHINFCNKFDDLYQKLAIRVWEEGCKSGYECGYNEGFNLGMYAEDPGLAYQQNEDDIPKLTNPYKEKK